jgi:hypothetical protein
MQTSLDGGKMEDPIQEPIRRARRYWYEDGLAEISIGGLFLLIGLLLWAQGAVPEASAAYAILAIAFPVVVIGGMLLGRRLIPAAKARLTYPRTGYVTYPPPSRRRRLVTVGIAITVASVVGAAALSLPQPPVRLLVLLQGLVLGVLLTVLGQGLPRFFFLGGWSAVLGVGLSRLAVPEETANGLLYGLTGVALLLSGGLVLARYLRQNRIPPQDAQP